LNSGFSALEDEPPASPLSNSPTLTLGHTRAGVILGMAAYMSPEQAVGRPVDRRSDIFSFGAVLYEMLTGKRAFSGGSGRCLYRRGKSWRLVEAKEWRRKDGGPLECPRITQKRAQASGSLQSGRVTTHFSCVPVRSPSTRC
jgi:serine/threonine protein kinase